MNSSTKADATVVEAEASDEPMNAGVINFVVPPFACEFGTNEMEFSGIDGGYPNEEENKWREIRIIPTFLRKRLRTIRT